MDREAEVVQKISLNGVERKPQGEAAAHFSFSCISYVEWKDPAFKKKLKDSTEAPDVPEGEEGIKSALKVKKGGDTFL